MAIERELSNSREGSLSEVKESGERAGTREKKGNGISPEKGALTGIGVQKAGSRWFWALNLNQAVESRWDTITGTRVPPGGTPDR